MSVSSARGELAVDAAGASALDIETAEKEFQPRRRRGPRFLPSWPAAVVSPDDPEAVGISPAELSAVWETGEPYRNFAGPNIATLLRRDALLRRLLAVCDVVAAYIALALATYLIGSGATSLQPWTLAIGPFIVLIVKAMGLYDRDQHLLRKSTIDETPHVLYLSVLYALGVWLCQAALLNGGLSRPQVFALAFFTFVLVLSGRALARVVAGALTPPERCLVIGSALAASRIARKLESTSAANAVIVGRISDQTDDAKGATHSLTQLGGPEVLVKAVTENCVERVIIVPEEGDEDTILDVIRLIKALGLKVSVLPRLLEVVGWSSSFDDVDGMWLLGVRHSGLTKSSALLKRAIDMAGAGGLLIVSLPVLLMIAAAIKLTSRGPVFFRQPRIGRRGRVFDMLKFRSMVADADRQKERLLTMNEAEGGLFKIARDPRVTTIGRFLRRTSLDELPQLINVLRGDMSLVGPRPLVPDEDALITGWQRRRLAMSPGMTGLWQIFGSARIPMHEMVKIDYIYAANWSIWLDFKILLRTVPYVLRQQGM